MKWAEIPDPADWGTRTDYVCASTPEFRRKRVGRNLPPLACEFWFLSKHRHEAPPGTRRASDEWFRYWEKYKVPGSELVKPSTGLRAVFCAVEFLKPDEIGLLGFDNVLHPERKPTTNKDRRREGGVIANKTEPIVG